MTLWYHTLKRQSQIHDVQKDADEEVPLGDHSVFCTELPGRIPQPRCGHQVREQEHHYPSVQLEHPSVLASQFHGWIYVEPTVCRCQE